MKDKKLDAIGKAAKEADVEELIYLLNDYWIYKDRIVYKKNLETKKWSLYLSTGGWSDHEEVIGILEGSLFWFMYWQKSERGGHYWFEGKLNKGNARRLSYVAQRRVVRLILP